MQEPVEITLVLDREDAEKLSRLAGEEVSISEYLTRKIQILYVEREIFGDTPSREHMVFVAQLLRQQNKEQDKLLSKFQAEVKNLLQRQKELVADISTLFGVISELRKRTMN